MPVYRHSPAKLVAYPQLVKRLASEWKSPNPKVRQPVVVEEANAQGDVAHVYVVWDNWAELDRLERGEIIMDAAEKVKSRDELLKITIAMGLTPEEADRFHLKWRNRA